MTIEINNIGKDVGFVSNISVKESISDIILDGHTIPNISTRSKVDVKFIIREYNSSYLNPTGHEVGPPEMYRYIKELNDEDTYIIGELYGEEVEVTSEGHTIVIAKVIITDTVEDTYDGDNIVV